MIAENHTQGESMTKEGLHALTACPLPTISATHHQAQVLFPLPTTMVSPAELHHANRSISNAVTSWDANVETESFDKLEATPLVSHSNQKY